MGDKFFLAVLKNFSLKDHWVASWCGIDFDLMQAVVACGTQMLAVEEVILSLHQCGGAGSVRVKQVG